MTQMVKLSLAALVTTGLMTGCTEKKDTVVDTVTNTVTKTVATDTTGATTKNVTITSTEAAAPVSVALDQGTVLTDASGAPVENPTVSMESVTEANQDTTEVVYDKATQTVTISTVKLSSENVATVAGTIRATLTQPSVEADAGKTLASTIFEIGDDVATNDLRVGNYAGCYVEFGTYSPINFEAYGTSGFYRAHIPLFWTSPAVVCPNQSININTFRIRSFNTYRRTTGA